MTKGKEQWMCTIVMTQQKEINDSKRCDPFWDTLITGTQQKAAGLSCNVMKEGNCTIETLSKQKV